MNGKRNLDSKQMRQTHPITEMLYKMVKTSSPQMKPWIKQVQSSNFQKTDSAKGEVSSTFEDYTDSPVYFAGGI